MYIVKQKTKNGKILLYSTESVYIPEIKQSRQKRHYIGFIDKEGITHMSTGNVGRPKKERKLFKRNNFTVHEFIYNDEYIFKIFYCKKYIFVTLNSIWESDLHHVLNFDVGTDESFILENIESNIGDLLIGYLIL